MIYQSAVHRFLLIFTFMICSFSIHFHTIMLNLSFSFDRYQEVFRFVVFDLFQKNDLSPYCRVLSNLMAERFKWNEDLIGNLIADVYYHIDFSEALARNVEKWMEQSRKTMLRINKPQHLQSWQMVLQYTPKWRPYLFLKLYSPLTDRDEDALVYLNEQWGGGEVSSVLVYITVTTTSNPSVIDWCRPWQNYSEYCPLKVPLIVWTIRRIVLFQSTIFIISFSITDLLFIRYNSSFTYWHSHDLLAFTFPFHRSIDHLTACVNPSAGLSALRGKVVCFRSSLPSLPSDHRREFYDVCSIFP